MSEARFRMRYGTPAVLIGWIITFVLYCVGLTVNVVVNDEYGSMGWGYLQFALFFGFPIAVVVGLPLAMFIAWPLRQVRNQGIHVIVFAVVVGLVMAALHILADPGQVRQASVFDALWVTACAAIGRAGVIKLVARRNATVTGHATRRSTPCESRYARDQLHRRIHP